MSGGLNFLRTLGWRIPFDSLEDPDLALDLALATLLRLFTGTHQAP